MKRFMYLSIGVLCLALSALIGFHLGSSEVTAQVDPSADIVATYSVGSNALVALDRFGQIWACNGSNVNPLCWEQVTSGEPPLPIPISEIETWYFRSLLAKNGDFWVVHELDWNNCGPWPGGTIPTTPSSMGEMKNKYRE